MSRVNELTLRITEFSKALDYKLLAIQAEMAEEENHFLELPFHKPLPPEYYLAEMQINELESELYGKPLKGSDQWLQMKLAQALEIVSVRTIFHGLFGEYIIPLD